MMTSMFPMHKIIISTKDHIWPSDYLFIYLFIYVLMYDYIYVLFVCRG